MRYRRGSCAEMDWTNSFLFFWDGGRFLWDVSLWDVISPSLSHFMSFSLFLSLSLSPLSLPSRHLPPLPLCHAKQMLEKGLGERRKGGTVVLVIVMHHTHFSSLWQQVQMAGETLHWTLLLCLPSPSPPNSIHIYIWICCPLLRVGWRRQAQ